MRRAGFRWIGVGVESASEQVREGVDKGFSQDALMQAIRNAEDAGIEVGANYIFGLPGETPETMRQTYDLSVQLNTTYANYRTLIHNNVNHQDAKTPRQSRILPE